MTCNVVFTNILWPLVWPLSWRFGVVVTPLFRSTSLT